MDFPLVKPEKPLIKLFSTGDIKIAHEFANKVETVFGDIVKSVVLSRETTVDTTDIPITVIIDDITQPFNQSQIEHYLKKMTNIVKIVSHRIKVTTLRLTEHWKKLQAKENGYIDFLRNSVALYDNGFYEPFQRLLAQGRIKPSMESRGIFYGQAQTSLKSSKTHIMQATVDLYWAAIDAAHAVLMKHNEMAPSPHDMAQMLRDTLVTRGKLEPEYAETMDVLYKTAKAIMHKEKYEISGKEFEEMFKRTEKFVLRMRKEITG